jgi:hypothetical protein
MKPPQRNQLVPLNVVLQNKNQTQLNSSLVSSNPPKTEEMKIEGTSAPNKSQLNNSKFNNIGKENIEN